MWKMYTTDLDEVLLFTELVEQRLDVTRSTRKGLFQTLEQGVRMGRIDRSVDVVFDVTDHIDR